MLLCRNVVLFKIKLVPRVEQPSLEQKEGVMCSDLPNSCTNDSADSFFACVADNASLTVLTYSINFVK